MFFLSFLVFLGFVGCSLSSPTFKDVVSGKIPLQPGEVEAVKTLLTDAGIPPGKFPVYVRRIDYDNAYVGQKILVENEYVTCLRINRTNLEHMDAFSFRYYICHYQWLRIIKSTGIFSND